MYEYNGCFSSISMLELQHRDIVDIFNMYRHSK